MKGIPTTNQHTDSHTSLVIWKACCFHFGVQGNVKRSRVSWDHNKGDSRVQAWIFVYFEWMSGTNFEKVSSIKQLGADAKGLEIEAWSLETELEVLRKHDAHYHHVITDDPSQPRDPLQGGTGG